jgi:hypothetical protein
VDDADEEAPDAWAVEAALATMDTPEGVPPEEVPVSSVPVTEVQARTSKVGTALRCKGFPNGRGCDTRVDGYGLLIYPIRISAPRFDSNGFNT